MPDRLTAVIGPACLSPATAVAHQTALISRGSLITKRGNTITATSSDSAQEVRNGWLTLRFLTTPHDVDQSGRQVQGGRVLEWTDRAGYACASAWSASYCVTAYVGNVHYDGYIGLET